MYMFYFYRDFEKRSLSGIFYNEIKTLLVIMYMLSLIGFHEDQTIIGRRIKFVFNHIPQNRSQKWTISPKNTLFHPYPSKYPYFNISISIKKKKNKLAETHHKSSPSHSCEVMKFGGASFVCRHTRESISYPPPKGRKSISSPIYLSVCCFCVVPSWDRSTADSHHINHY